MCEAEQILEKVGIRCSLGAWSNEEGHYAICYTRKQGETWLNRLRPLGYDGKVLYEQYAYIVHFNKK